MTSRLKFAVVGGDARQVQLSALLAENGHEVYTFALDLAELSSSVICGNDISQLRNGFDCVILPIPIKSDEEHLNTPLSSYQYLIDEIFTLLPTGQTVIAGRVDNALFEKAGRSGIRLYDYLEREDFTVYNSIATAEGAVHVAMSELKTNLNRKKCLVIGFGHIGKLLSRYLDGLGAIVTATARKFGDLAWISAYGYNVSETKNAVKSLSDFDIIFNTVPSLILDEKSLLSAKSDVFICDLASKPGGVDFNMAKKLGLHTVHALSLPGKYAPKSAAEALKNTIYNILDEWGK
ncbi:MAG: dipicolinate synthase subunit DpsA [Oscillospiraceae bacterium]|nr:dipicolinate synthase subunit DpsA [Oscillospiraceae bacterium]MBQ4544782.1 dipicolinate synthase subunit DpsA [Oscillospiraceae bacterium]MBQ6901834.1 dipicolinate synthase subunit DpsA [Oscillospiraceae bacterium]